jgi:hypothetical protein
MLEPTHNDLTEEQAAKAARLIEAFLARYEAGVCPRCGTPITREIGVGQDVYAQPCGCRVGQGVAGRYDLPAPEEETTVAVKIIDMLGEEVLVTAMV